jgi:hypothetical protein
MSEDLPDCESEAIEMWTALDSVMHMDICSTPPADFNHNTMDDVSQHIPKPNEPGLPC